MTLPSLEQIEKDPAFASASYEEQVTVRNLWARAFVDSLKKQGAPILPQEEEEFVQMTTSLPPVLNLENLTSYGKERMWLTNLIRSNSPVAGVLAGMLTFWNSFMDASGIVKFFLHRMEDVGEAVTGMQFQGDEYLFDAPRPKNADDVKAGQYFTVSLLQSPGIRTLASIGELVGFGASKIADIASMKILLHPITGPLVGGLYGSVAAKLAETALVKSQFGRWVLESSIPTLLRATEEAVYGIASDYLAARYTNPDQLPKEFTPLVGWAVSTGFNYVLGDMVVHTGWSLLKAIVGVLPKTFGKGFKVNTRLIEEALEDPKSMDQVTQMMDSILSGKDMDPKVFSVLPDSARETYVRMQARFNVLHRMKKTGVFPSESELDEMVALAKGYDMKVTKKGVTLQPVVQGLPEIKGTFTDTRSALLSVYKELNVQPSVDAVMRTPTIRLTKELEDKIPYNARVLLAADVLKNLRIKGVPGVEVTDPKALDTVRTQFQKWFKMAGKEVSVEIVPGSEYMGETIQKKIREWATRPPTEGVPTLYIPDSITNYKEFLRTFGMNLSAVTGEDRKVLRSVLGGLSTTFVNQYDDSVLEMLAKRKFPQATLTLDEAAKKYGVDLGDGHVLSFPTKNELGRYLLRELPTTEQVAVYKEYLKNRLDIDLVERAKGGYLLKSRGHILTEVSSPEQLIEVLYERKWIPGLPSEWAPQPLITSQKSKKGEVVGIFHMEAPLLVGTPEFVRERLAKFENLANQKIVRQLGTYVDGKVQVQKLTKMYQIEVLDTGAKVQFPTLDEAKEFLGKLKSKADILELTANLKGFFVTAHQGQWVLKDTYKRGAKPLTFSSADEALAYLRDVPMPKKLGRELTALDDAFIQYLYRGNEDLLTKMEGLNPSYVGQFDEFRLEAALINKAKEKTPMGSSPGTTVSALVAPMDVFAQKAAKDLGLEELYTKYRDFAKAANAMEAQILRANAMVTSLFKGFSHKDLKNMLALFDVEDRLWAQTAQKLGFSFTPEMERALKGLRELYRKFSQVFGIDMTIVHKNFLPRARELVEDPARLAKYGVSDSAIRVLASEFPGYTPKELEFFAKNMRVKDLVSYVETADIVSVTQKYIRQGYKNMILDPVYRDLREFVGKVVAEKDLTYAQRFVRFMEHMIGSDIDLEGAFLKKASLEASTQLFTELGKRLKSEGMSKKQVEDVLSAMNSLMVSATMAFRPVLVLRNLTQTLTTVAPRLGLTPTVRALKKAIDLDPDSVARILSDLGESLQQAPFLNLYDIQYPLKKLSHVGMVPYRNADTFNRVVTYLAVEDVFDYAVKKWNQVDPKTGKRFLNEKEFVSLAGLKYLGEMDQKNILEILKKKGPEAAKVEFASKLIYETQFPYKAAENPLLFHGLWGRLFGAFGTYPVFYVANVMRGLRNGGVTGALQFGSRLAVVTAVLSTVYEKILGIPATSVTPWGQATFDGGPFYKLMNKTLTALRPGYEGDMARKNLLDEWARILTPGSVQLRSIQRALEAADKGDTYEALVRLLGSSYVGEDN